MNAARLDFPPRVRAVIERCAEEGNISVAAMITGPQTRRAVNAKRQVARELRRHGFSLNEIGAFLQRDNSTVLYYLTSGPPTKSPRRAAAPDWPVWQEIPCPDLSGEWAI
jgi:hypothetical protein